MATRKKTPATPLDGGEAEFSIVLSLCRSAVATGDEVLRHQVERLLEHLQEKGRSDEAAAVSKLLKGADKSASMTPVRLMRSFASGALEQLTPSVRAPVDKETAAPLADIIWPDQLPSSSPILPEELQAAFDGFISEWKHTTDLLKIGVEPTRSALIFGLPGTGKTHVALWLARQLGLPAVVARLDGMISSFLGTTSRNIGSLFDFAGRYECVLVLDEFDAVAKLRDDPHEMGEIKRVVNTLLQRLDQRRKVGITLGITNHEQLLDPAVWRRFDVQLSMPKPSMEARRAILQRYLRPLSESPATEQFLAWLCADMTGAQIESFVQTYKRLSVLGAVEQPSVFSISRVASVLHAERIDAVRREVLNQAETSAVRMLASETNAGLDTPSLAIVFNKSKSTIARWINS